MTKKFGFTLAEVLITLGIIGVVAAMSIPTLIANTNSAKFSSQFKKSLAALNQASLMSQAQYDMNFGSALEIAVVDGNLDPRSNDAGGGSLASVLMGTLSGAEYYGSLDALTNSQGESYSVKTMTNANLINAATKIVKMQDGSIFVFNAGEHTGNATCSVDVGQNASEYTTTLVNNNCVGFIDVNGATLPNKEVTCSDNTAAIYATGESGTAPSCNVPRDANHMTDIYPVVIHDGVVEPATTAARAVLAAK